MDEPGRIFVKVARYHDAIQAARLEGYTWKELLAALSPLTGVKDERRLADAFKRAARSIEDGRLSPRQLPLPLQGAHAAPRLAGEARQEGASRPLPGDPSRRMPAAGEDARAELERRGIKFS